MPKCSICGRKFATISALEAHHRAVHPNSKFSPPSFSARRNLLTMMIIILVAVGALVGYLIYYQSQQNPQGSDSYLFNSPISSALYQNLTDVSFSTLSSIGTDSATYPTPISSSSPLTLDGKPEILYIGAEFCPFCAAERWSLVIALAKFGNFSNLEYMRSAANDGNIATLTFLNVNYTSKYVAFVSVENEDRNRNPLQATTQTEQQLWDKYDANSYPFIDIGGEYIITSSQFPYSDLYGLNWTQIASQLNNPGSSVAKAIDGAANTLISVICKVDGGNPGSVCSQSFAKLSLESPQSSADEAFCLASANCSTHLTGEGGNEFISSRYDHL
jgi:thiol-disulfide isomerase/thioredoxin